MAQVQPKPSAVMVTKLQLQAVLSGTSILTSDGELPVEYLQPGDRVLTRSGMRRLTRVEITVIQNARVVCIAHGTLGVDRPADDVTVSSAQHILVRDWRAKAMFGTATALVSATRLVDGEFIRAMNLSEARFYTLCFEEDAVVFAAGLELFCPAHIPALSKALRVMTTRKTSSARCFLSYSPKIGQ